MRIITPEYEQELERLCPAYATIKHTPRPDFTEMKRESREFAEWIAGEHAKERKIMMEALQNARARNEI